MLCCPVCQSRDVFLVAGGYLGTIYRCKKCRYQGSFIVETGDEDPNPAPSTGH
ncbi:MAG: hypothetical protein LUQ40_05335 [Methanomicrobiales archaeon]|nr:hypothetical protein [Methanomicrobiales archaeon]